MTYDEWAEKYKPHDRSYETFGDDLEIVLAAANEDKAWTLIEVDRLRYILAGFHHVNRINYVLTENPRESNFDWDTEIIDTDIEEPFNRLLDLITDFVQPEGEGWALFNLPTNPTCPKDFLTCGIEKLDEEGVFERDDDAFDYVFDRALQGSQHKLAIDINEECDLIREILWGDRDTRTPPNA